VDAGDHGLSQLTIKNSALSKPTRKPNAPTGGTDG
jgi:hypothetical protein